MCDQCIDGYFAVHGGNACKPCGQSCTSCVDARQCRPGSCTGGLSVVGGRCVRCDDPRCGDCTGNAAVCKVCKDPSFKPHRQTGRCQPAGPRPAEGRAGRCAGGVCLSPILSLPAVSHAHLPAPSPTAPCRRPQPTAAKPASLQRPAPAIIGGVAAERGRFPYAASLRMNVKAELYPHYCGASLVHPRVLLSAAHVSVWRVSAAAARRAAERAAARRACIHASCRCRRRCRPTTFTGAAVRGRPRDGRLERPGVCVPAGE